MKEKYCDHWEKRYTYTPLSYKPTTGAFFQQDLLLILTLQKNQQFSMLQLQKIRRWLQINDTDDIQ